MEITTLLQFLAILIGILFIFTLFMLKRNFDVYEFRRGLLDKISVKAREDIAQGKDFRRWYDYFDSVTYNEMMLKFWKPLNSFYKDEID